jgi:hypothetical protein
MTLSSHHRATIEKILGHPASGLRRLLTQAGYGEPEAVEDTRDRDHGDGRWGKPE